MNIDMDIDSLIYDSFLSVECNLVEDRDFFFFFAAGFSLPMSEKLYLCVFPIL